MNKNIMMLILCAAFLSISPAASFAQNKNEKNAQAAQDVFATKSGKKYHKSDCPFVQNRNPEKFSKKDALAKGLAPCPKCFKEDLPPASKKNGSNK